MDSRAKMKRELIATEQQLDGHQERLQDGPREQQLDGRDHRQQQDANLSTNLQQQDGQNHKLSDHHQTLMPYLIPMEVSYYYNLVYNSAYVLT